jgi:hypothetical protein
MDPTNQLSGVSSSSAIGSRSRMWIVFTAGAAFGIVLWIFAVELFGAAEPWDGTALLYILLLFAFGAVSGGLAPRRFWAGPAGVYAGQAAWGLAVWVKSLVTYTGGGVNFFVPLGLMYLAIATIPALVGATLGALMMTSRLRPRRNQSDL